MDERTRVALEHNELRMVGDGVHLPDLVELRREVEDWAEWFAWWAALADRYEEIGDRELAGGRHVSAGENLWQASICWQYAQFLWFHEPEERLEGQHRKVQTYRKAAPYLVPRAERFDIPFEGTRVPGYLRLAHEERPASCAILIGGLESTKEESYHFENMLLKRGVSTFSFDGPGQGEYFEQQPFAQDFERYTSAVVDALVSHDLIESDRIGVLGRSLGGYLAVRSAALEPRLKACVAWGALYDLGSFFDNMEERTRDGFRYITAIPDPELAKETIIAGVDLHGVAEQLDRPLYILHGALDPLIPVSQAHKLDDNTPRAPTTLVIEPQGDHCAHNLYHRVRPAMADWLAEQL